MSSESNIEILARLHTERLESVEGEIELERGFKIRQSDGIWAAYAPQGSGSGYYSTEKQGYWYASGTRARAESMVRVWIMYQDTDWSDPSWDE